MTSADGDRIERILTEFRISVGAQLATLMEKLDSMKNHEERLRKIESSHVNHEQLEKAITACADSVRRPAWKDIAAIIFTITSIVGLLEYFGTR